MAARISLRIVVVCVALAWAWPAAAQDAGKPASPWLLAPLVSSNPKLGTSFGAMGGYARRFDPASRVSLFGVIYQYTTTKSTVAAAVARTSFGADHHRIIGLAVFGYIKNNYDNYLGTGQPLQTNDDMRAFLGRYVYRLKGNWFVGAQGSAANYQVLGETAQDDLVLETLGVRGFESAALGAVVIHDSRDGEDMPTRGWLLSLNNLAYRDALGGSSTFDTYRADFKAFLKHGGRHVLAVRQYNWFTVNAPANAEAAVLLRGYKIGEYLSPHMSSFEAEERFSLGTRWGATFFAGVASLYGTGGVVSAARTFYPAVGGGIHFVIKPEQRLVVNFEYAQGIENNRGVFLKFGYGW